MSSSPSCLTVRVVVVPVPRLWPAFILHCMRLRFLPDSFVQYQLQSATLDYNPTLITTRDQP